MRDDINRVREVYYMLYSKSSCCDMAWIKSYDHMSAKNSVFSAVNFLYAYTRFVDDK